MTIPIDDPHAIANLIVTELTFNGELGLRWWRDSFYLWMDDRYIEIPEETIRCDTNSFIEKLFALEYKRRMEKLDPDKTVPKKLSVTGKLVSNVIQAIKSKTHVPHFVPMNAWIGGDRHGETSPVFITLKNGIIDSRQFVRGEPITLITNSPNWFSTTRLPIEFNPEATCPKWSEFLDTNLQRNDEQIAMLQEWFGYCLTPDTSFQKFLILEGEGKNGKSVICAALAALLGGNNVSHVPLESFCGNFALAATLGKLANIASEVGEIDKAAEGTLKSFTAGDRMEFNRKFKDPINATPTARLVLATNNRPRFADKSSGLWRRMLLLPMNWQVPEDQRVFGMDRAEFWKPELPGILNWALDGLAELHKYRRFTESEASKIALDDYKSDSNPARDFLRDRYEFTGRPSDWVTTQAIYTTYRRWCEVGGYSPVNDKNLGKEVSRLWPESKRERRRDGGERIYVYNGLRELFDAAISTADAAF